MVSTRKSLTAASAELDGFYGNRSRVSVNRCFVIKLIGIEWGGLALRTPVVYTLYFRSLNICLKNRYYSAIVAYSLIFLRSSTS